MVLFLAGVNERHLRMVTAGSLIILRQHSCLLLAGIWISAFFSKGDYSKQQKIWEYVTSACLCLSSELECLNIVLEMVASCAATCGLKVEYAASAAFFNEGFEI